jgi:CRISPR/Cas system-associated protein endoribonuclease Cas2
VRYLRAEIARLQEMGPNEGRAKQIRLLERQLAKLESES